MALIASTTLSLKWNIGVPEGFCLTKGLRQGIPLSPYLFLLYMEKLATMIQEIVANKKWLLVKIAKGGPAISYLIFSNGWLLFTAAKSIHVRLV